MGSLKILYNTCEEQYDAAIATFEEKNPRAAADLENEESRLLLWNLDAKASSGLLDSFNERFQFLHREIYYCLNEISSALIQLARIPTLGVDDPSSQEGNQHQSEVTEVTGDICSDTARLQLEVDAESTQYLPATNPNETSNDPTVATLSPYPSQQEAKVGHTVSGLEQVEPATRLNTKDIIEHLKTMNDFLFSLQRATALATRESPSQLLALENDQNESLAMFEAISAVKDKIGEQNRNLDHDLTHTTGEPHLMPAIQSQNDTNDILDSFQTKGETSGGGGDNLETIRSDLDMAYAHARQGQYTQALDIYRRVLAYKQEALGEEDPSTLDTINDMGIVYNNQGDYQEALKWFSRALNGKEKALGGKHLSTLDTINSIGIAYNNQGDYQKALGCSGRALGGKLKVLGGEHPSTLDTINSIGIAYNNQGDYQEALRWSKRVLAGKEKSLGGEHPSTLNTVNDIGIAYSNQGDYQEALNWFNRALDGKEKALGKDHPSTLDTVNDIGIICNKLGEYQKAHEWLMRALGVKKKVLGVEHPSTLDTINDVGIVFSNRGWHKRALEWLRQALTRKEKALGEEHPSTLNTVNDIGIAYSNQEDYQEALIWLMRALDGKEGVLGLEHLSTLDTVDDMGIVYHKRGWHLEAQKYLNRALDGKRKALGNKHPSTLETLNKLESINRMLEDSRAYGRGLQYTPTLSSQIPENPLAENITTPEDPWRSVQGFLF